MKIEQMEGKSGRPVENQFIIRGTEKYFQNGEECEREVVYFQSYQTIIAKKEGGKVYLDESSWDYSVTTGKYRNIFLNDTKKETERKIKSGEYILTDLNK